MAPTATRQTTPEATSGPTSPSRIKGFVKYFNSYIASIFVAAIPAPLSQWRLMPILDDQRGLLSISTPIFCFLTLACLFFIRDALAGPMFPLHARRGRLVEALQLGPRNAYIATAFWRRLWGLVPLACICGSLYFASIYYSHFYEEQRFRSTPPGTPGVVSPSLISPSTLPLYYVLAFVLAEAAFVWMALKEYIQDVLGLSDRELIQDTTLQQTPGLTADLANTQVAPTQI